MSRLRIGTAGIPLAAQPRTSCAGVEKLVELGLDCMELEFVRSVQMQEQTARELRDVCEENQIELTVHAPYYINLNSKDPQKVEASKARILKAARIGWLAGAKSVTFHAAYYHGDDHSVVFEKVKQELVQVRAILDDEGNSICLCPETTGSSSQFGTVTEIVSLALEIPGVYPCIDFSHLHARSVGAMNSYEEFRRVIHLIGDKLGRSALEHLHMHLSGIEYGAKGERKHLTLPESDMNYPAVLQVLADCDVSGWLICESPNLEEDALLLKHEYTKITNIKGGIHNG